jgi:two-component system nitrogen regulation sensor histidine kinase GlnL
MAKAALESLLSSLPVGVVSIDDAGQATHQNPEASRILGVSPETTTGRTLARVLGQDHPLLLLVAEALETRRSVSRRATELLQFPVGRPLVVDLAATPLGPGEEPEGVVVTLTDRTIGRELEELERQRRRADEFAQLAAGIAHEIRNPLGGIRGAAQLLLKRLADADLCRYPELIRDEVDRLSRLLDDLAQLTRGDDFAPADTNLHRVLDDVIELHSSDPAWQGVRFVREYDPSIPDLELDPDRIAQVVLNLLRNAVQAVDGKGRVLLRTRVGTPFRLTRHAEPHAPSVRLEVEDDGPGIPPEDLPHIFTPFFTRRERGTGLGLAIAQHWIVRHGGRVRARSEQGSTCFEVTLPLRRGAGR